MAFAGFANMRDYMQIGENDQPRLDWRNLTREQAASLQEVNTCGSASWMAERKEYRAAGAGLCVTP